MLEERPLSYRPIAKPKGRRQPTGGAVGRPSKSDKRAKNCTAGKAAWTTDTSVHEVKSEKGEVRTHLQSRIVLMLLFDLRKEGCSENEVVLQVARTFKIGHDKVRRINNHWWDHRQLYETTAAGRGKTAKKDDGRRRLTKAQEDQLREFINDEHKAGRQVFRRTVAEWMHRTCNMEQPSNRSAGGLLSRLGFKRRRGRIKTPPLNAERLARIRRFLVEMDMAKRAEDAG
ncbi:unnamed protein product [Ectocarpus sp. CCAP 1310/34]|nr:unnamed protein product [Ectocarpus sp. CCAP 1310/34]